MTDGLVAALARAQAKFPPMDFRALPDNLRSKLVVNVTTGCWEWAYARSPLGYGRGWDGTRVRLSHHLTYEFFHGPVVNELDHLCYNPPCCNPAHLEDVTHQVNLQRAAARITACPQGHSYLDPRNVAIYDGKRDCLECARQGANRRRLANPPPLKGPWSEQRVCDECGDGYKATQPWQRFCGRKCGRLNYNKARRRT